MVVAQDPLSAPGVFHHANPNRRWRRRGSVPIRERPCRGRANQADILHCFAGELYAPLWQAYLSGPDNEQRRGRDFARMARKHLATQGFERLGQMEQRMQARPSARRQASSCGLIDLNPHTFENCRDFFNGIRAAALLRRRSLLRTDRAIARVFEEMENLWRQISRASRRRLFARHRSQHRRSEHVSRSARHHRWRPRTANEQVMDHSP